MKHTLRLFKERIHRLGRLVQRAHSFVDQRSHSRFRYRQAERENHAPCSLESKRIMPRTISCGSIVTWVMVNRLYIGLERYVTKNNNIQCTKPRVLLKFVQGRDVGVRVHIALMASVSRRSKYREPCKELFLTPKHFLVDSLENPKCYR